MTDLQTQLTTTGRVVIAQRVFPELNYKYIFDKDYCLEVAQSLQDKGYQIDNETTMDKQKSEFILTAKAPMSAVVLDVKGNVIKKVDNGEKRKQ